MKPKLSKNVGALKCTKSPVREIVDLANCVSRGMAANSIRPCVRQTAKLYDVAAKRTVQAINEHLKLPCLVPQGGLYTVVYTGVESSAFTMNVLKKTGVIAVPGRGFGDTLKKAVRLSYGPLVHHLDRIDAAMKRVGDFLEKRKNNGKTRTTSACGQ